MNRRNLHRTLKALKKEVLQGGPIELKYGICANVELCARRHNIALKGFQVKILADIWADWPEFSGDFGYPVKDPAGNMDGYFAHIEARINLNKAAMWDGAYGAARLRLLDYLIEQTARPKARIKNEVSS